MVYQIWIMFLLYILGFGFIVLFYPKIPYSLCIMSALFWGALIYIFSAVFLSFLGLYTRFIWVLLCIEISVVTIKILKRKIILKAIPWRKTIIWFAVLLCLFSSVFLIADNKLVLLTPDSKFYLRVSREIFRFSSFKTNIAGLFFRERLVFSEVLMHSLASFINQPVLTLWHPYLWITLYGSFFSILYDFINQKIMNKPASIFIPLLMTSWVGTAGLNWINGYYINGHLIAATSIFFVFYFFERMVTSDVEEPEYGFLGAIALSLFGLTRVESPVVIGFFLIMLMGAKIFSRKEILVTFIFPILLEIVLLSYILISFLGFETIKFWSDSRLKLAIGAQILFAMFFVFFFINEKLQDLVKKYLTQIVFVLLINISLLLLIFKPNHQVGNSIMILRQLFDVDIWGYYWGLNLLIVVTIFIFNKSFHNKNHFSKTLKFIGMMILAYILIILDVGYFRTPYDLRWTDSASRMFSHISPIIGFYICRSISNFLLRMNIFKNKLA